MKEQTKHVILVQIEKSIEDLQKKIAELEIARGELLSSNLTGDSKKKSGRRRLPAGAPRRMALVTIRARHRLFVSEWVERIEEEFDKRLNDSTIRRAIAELEKDGIIVKMPDGSYEFRGSPPVTESEDKSDDLPF